MTTNGASQEKDIFDDMEDAFSLVQILNTRLSDNEESVSEDNLTDKKPTPTVNIPQRAVKINLEEEKSDIDKLPKNTPEEIKNYFLSQREEKHKKHYVGTPYFGYKSLEEFSMPDTVDMTNAIQIEKNGRKYNPNKK